MLRALICGETEPQVPVELAKGELRRKLPALRKALTPSTRGIPWRKKA